VLPRATRAHRLTRLHVKKQAAALFAPKVEPHQVLRHLFPLVKKRPANLEASYRNRDVDVQPEELYGGKELAIGAQFYHLDSSADGAKNTKGGAVYWGN
jgi:hypothetical protein